MLWHPLNKASRITTHWRLKKKGRQEIPQWWCTWLVDVSSAPRSHLQLWWWHSGCDRQGCTRGIPARDSCSWACWILAIMPYFLFFLFSKLEYSRGGFIQTWSLNQTWRWKGCAFSIKQIMGLGFFRKENSGWNVLFCPHRNSCSSFFERYKHTNSSEQECEIEKCVIHCPYDYPAKSTHYEPLKNDNSLILKTC